MGWALGQLVCTQYWKNQYAPRFLVPWGICLVCLSVLMFTCPLLDATFIPDFPDRGDHYRLGHSICAFEGE